MHTERLKFIIGALGLSKILPRTSPLVHACAVSAVVHTLVIGFAEAETFCSDGPLFSVQSFSGFSSYRSGGDGSSCPDPWYDVQTHAEQLTCNPMQGLFEGGWSIQAPYGIITSYMRSGNFSCRPNWWYPNGSISFDATIQFKQNTLLSVTTPFTRTFYSESDCNLGPATTFTFALKTAAGSALAGTPISKVCQQGSVTIDLGRRYSLPPGTYRLHAQADSPRSQIWSVYPDPLVLVAEVRTIAVPGDALTVGAAIELAESGDVIAVMEGTYRESIDLKGKSITIRATGSRTNTILDGTGLTSPVVRATSGESSATLLQGFTIRNGTAGSLVNGQRVGGGMFVRNASPTIRDCAFVSNSAEAGGGLAAINSQSVIDGCTFSTNAAGTGGGLWLDGGRPTVSGCVVTSNTASGHGGGLYSTPIPGQLPNVVLVGNTLCSNTSADAGRENLWALFDDGGNAICDCVGDVDGNGVTDTADISLTLLFFGSETDPDFIQPDQDVNGTVNTGDVSLLLLNFGSCS